MFHCRCSGVVGLVLLDFGRAQRTVRKPLSVCSHFPRGAAASDAKVKFRFC